MRINYVDENNDPQPMPDWADWLIFLGQTIVQDPCDACLREWIVVSVPDRTFASSLVATGAAYAASESIDQGPTQDRFTHYPLDECITWIDGNDQVRFGRYRGISEGYISYLPRSHGGWGPAIAKRPIELAESFWPAPEEGEFTGGRPAAENLAFLKSVLGESTLRWIAHSSTEIVLVGTRTEIERDLDVRQFTGRVDCAAGALKDLVRPRGGLGLGQHYRSLIVPGSSDPMTVHVKDQNLAVFDGPGAYLRLRDSVSARSSVVILDRWNARSSEAATAAMIDRNDTWIDKPTRSIPAAPGGIELYQWISEA